MKRFLVHFWKQVTILPAVVLALSGCPQGTGDDDSIENSPTPTANQSPTPGPDSSPTQGPDESPTPGPDTSPTPIPDLSPTPGPDSSPTPVPWELAQSEKSRDMSPETSDVPELVEGNTAFATDLYQKVREEIDGNFFYSPYSISLAFAMTYAGAVNQTAEQMAATLHFTLPQEQLHPAFDALDLELASRGEPIDGEDGDPFQLRIANSIWGQAGYAFEQPFLDILAESYGAGLRLLNFGADPEWCRSVINNWVLNQTEDRIKDLLAEGTITGDTKLVLANAIYFNASWQDPFDVANTSDRPFTLLDGTEISVPTMHHTLETRYVDGDGYQALELRYVGHQLSMLLILPDEDDFETFEARLEPSVLTSIGGELSEYSVTVEMPKFSYDTNLATLKQILVDLGMVDAMDSNLADFSGISTASRLFISAVAHKAFVAVDETGTEAAAATAVVVSDEGIPESAEISLNRPFIYMIRDNPTGAILFLGRILNPVE